MRPIINMPQEDRVTDIGNTYKKLVTITHVVPEISSRTYRQTDTQTDILITILRNREVTRSIPPPRHVLPVSLSRSGCAAGSVIRIVTKI